MDWFENDVPPVQLAPTRRNITAPGIYQMTREEYGSAHCPKRSLSATGAKMLISDCPAAYKYTPSPIKTEFDIGSAAHLLVLQPEEFESNIGIVPFDDYKKKDATASRDDIRESGRIPLLPKQIIEVQNMRAAVFADPVASLAFTNGKAEQSIFWEDKEFDIWCKTRPDWLPDHRRYLVDVKTSTKANPSEFARSIVNFGYHQQAAWYLDGVKEALGEAPERFAFVVVSKKPPYLVSTCWLDAEAIEWGRILNRRARGLFAWCVKHDTWPSYRPDTSGPPAAFTISLPGWASRDLQRRHEAGEFEVPEGIEV